MTRDYSWRTAPIGAEVEGTSIRYVDSSTGSDLKGLGTRAKPYQSLSKAWTIAGAKPVKIICRGVFTENMGTGTGMGNHNCEINGDYFGAATFDGNDEFIIYGFRHNKMVIINTASPTGSGMALFAGVGSAITAYSVGNANSVYGVAGSSVLVDNTALYWGVIGGTTAVAYNCYSRPKITSIYKVSLGMSSNQTLPNNTIYGCDITKRSYRVVDSASRVAAAIRLDMSIIANFDMYADEPVILLNTLIAADCNWYYTQSGELLKIIVDKLEPLTTPQFTYDAINLTMTVGGGTGATQVVDIPTAITALVANGNILTANRPTFTNCKFSKQNSAQIFNNCEKQDFTLKPNGDGVITSVAYYGAFPPSLNIPITNYSAGQAATWDETTAVGLINVDDDCIKYDETALETSGSISSKVVAIDTSKYNIAAIYANFISNFKSHGSALWSPNLKGASYSAGDLLPIGRYLIQGSVTYNSILMQKIKGDIIVVTETGTTFSTTDGSTLNQLLDSNISDVVYVRTTPAIYVNVKQGDGLQEGCTYMNCGEENITYKGRVVAPKESFVAKNNTDDFIHADANYRIGVAFDDTRIPLEIRQKSQWIPAQLFGEYFVVKNRDSVKLDDFGVPVSSGNYLSWADYPDGYVSFKRKAVKERYVQFKIVIQKVYDNVI